MKSTLIDNTPDRMMVDTLKECIADQHFNEIMIATGFWDLPGTNLVVEQLSDFLSREGTSMRLLIGTDPTVRRQYLNEKFPDEAIKKDIFELEFNEQYQPLIDLLFKYCRENPDDSKLKIRIYKRDPEGNAQFLHSKCYIFTDNVDEAVGIIGSSNFTQKGLEGNAELNYLESDARIVHHVPAPNSKLLGHRSWFTDMWEQSEDWNGTFINEILSKAPIAVDNPNNPDNQSDLAAPQELTPYDLYIKYLQMQFGDMVDANVGAMLASFLPAKFDSLEYQMDAVKQCYSTMKRFGGFLHGDVVGLGKTVVGMLLIRYFLENAEILGRTPKVLIVTPPAIQEGWMKTIRDFDEGSNFKIEPCVTFVTTGSIDKLADAEDADDGDDDTITLKADNYGLVVIDESHNFRNANTQKYEAINNLIGIINPVPFVALLSATPQNNSPKDIYNQIRLFQRTPNESNLPGVEGGKLDSFFNAMEKRYKEARNLPQDTAEGRAEAKKIIKEVSEQVRKCVLNDILIRRTRTDIKKMYGADAELLKFPTVIGPHKLEYTMDDELQQLFFDTINAICPPAPGEPYDPNRHIGFFRYAAITQFVDPNNAKLYEKRNLKVEGITKRLQRIMRMLLVKRLESSLSAFKTTLENIGRYNSVMIDMLEHDCVYICPDVDVNKLHRESNRDFEKFQLAMLQAMEGKDPKNRRYKASDFHPQYINDLRRDALLIDSLLERWRDNSEDPKFDCFKESLKPELFAPDINNPSGINAPRLVIFTEAIDTLESISRYLRAKKYKVLEVTSKNRGDLEAIIQQNFDAKCKPEDRRDDYNVIVTTEVLAEGVNLHRANVILNYDAPWNATRLMQRIGRVNRIGSVEEFVHVFNFFPSNEGNSQIRLIEKAYAKLQSFHEMFGEDNKVFSEREELSEHDLQKFVDGDESPFGPFINELKAFRNDNPERYEWIASLDPVELGGSIAVAEKGDSIYVFTDNSKSYVSVEVDTSADDPKAKVVSTLTTMEMLKCDPEATFVETSLTDPALMEIAKRAYQRHVAHYLLKSDSSKQGTDALKVINEIKGIPGISLESRKLLTAMEKAVRAKDTYLISLLRKFNLQQYSLFGVDEDINALLQASFANTASRAQIKRGDAVLSLFETR